MISALICCWDALQDLEESKASKKMQFEEIVGKAAKGTQEERELVEEKDRIKEQIRDWETLFSEKRVRIDDRCIRDADR